MPNEEIKPLSGKEYESVGWSLFETISTYEALPSGVTLDYQSLDGTNHIGFFTVPGGKYTWEDVTGGFGAQLPFDIVYKLNASANGQLLTAEEFINKLADYLSEPPYPVLTGGRTVEKIIMNSVTYRTKAEDDGSVTFARSGVLKYEKV